MNETRLLSLAGVNSVENLRELITTIAAIWPETIVEGLAASEKGVAAIRRSSVVRADLSRLARHLAPTATIRRMCEENAPEIALREQLSRLGIEDEVCQSAIIASAKKPKYC